jgi:predicted phage terminase large subunit-like protein
VTGGGFDLIIVDDLISAKSVLTRNQIEKTRQWFFEVIETTLFPWGAIFVIGTRWHHDDIYGELIKPVDKGGKGWKHTILKAILNEEDIIKKKAEPQVLWPAFWSYEKLMAKRAEIGTIWFNCQYQNDPTSLQGDLLKSDWLHPYPKLPPNLPLYAGVDPALGEGDMQAISVYAFNRPMKQAYLIEVWCKAVDLHIFFQTLNTKHTQMKFSKIFVEANSFQKVLFHLPELKHLPMVPVVTVKNKEQRFIPMSSHFEADRVLVDPLLRDPTSEFYRQWVEFPRGRNDDALDAVELPLPYLFTAGASDAWIVG